MAKIVAFTQREKILLANLVAHHPIVENKKTDAATIQMKNAEWKKIVENYNAQGDIISGPRTEIQLKKLWNNMKQRKRQENTSQTYQRLKTGGGPPVRDMPDPVMESVSVAAPDLDITIPCLFDSTAVMEKAHGLLNDDLTMEEGRQASLVEDSEVLLASPAPNTIVPTESASSRRWSAKAGKLRISKAQSECDLRLEKLKESIQQQAELHEIRMQIEMERLKTEKEIFKKASAERRKAEHEEEMAYKMCHFEMDSESN